MTIRLGSETDTSLVVLDPQGRPCSGALVEPRYVRTATVIDVPPDEWASRVGARTDAEGRVKLPAIAREVLDEVPNHHQGLWDSDAGMPMSAGPPTVGPTIRLRPAGRIEGRVIADRPENSARPADSSRHGRRPGIRGGVPTGGYGGSSPTSKAGSSCRRWPPESCKSGFLPSTRSRSCARSRRSRSAWRRARRPRWQIPMAPTVVVRGSILPRTPASRSPARSSKSLMGAGGGAHRYLLIVAATLKRTLIEELKTLKKIKPDCSCTDANRKVFRHGRMEERIMSVAIAQHYSSIRVRYADTDQMRVVHHSKYFEYFEIGRSDLIRALGMPVRGHGGKRNFPAGYRSSSKILKTGSIR